MSSCARVKVVRSRRCLRGVPEIKKKKNYIICILLFVGGGGGGVVLVEYASVYYVGI